MTIFPPDPAFYINYLILQLSYNEPSRQNQHKCPWLLEFTPPPQRKNKCGFMGRFAKTQRRAALLILVDFKGSSGWWPCSKLLPFVFLWLSLI